MTPTPASVVSGAPAAPAAAAPAAAAAAVPAVVDTAVFQRQIDELKEQVAEGQRTAQYWADKARAGGAPPAAAVVEDEPDVLEAITTGGAKGFDKLASARGFIRKDEVEALINQRATSLTEEQQLIQDYPDLKKKDSEFFKATALVYGTLVKNGMPQALAMGTAARQAELDFIKGGKIKLPGAEPTAAEKEATRLRRIAAQGGDEGGRRPAPGAEEDTELTPEQKHIARAMGISEEAYAKRAKSGVSIRGGMGGR